VAGYLSTRPKFSYQELADELGPDDLVAAQVENFQWLEALETGTLREAAQDSLVRCLVGSLNLRGWGEGINFESRRARAFAHWVTSLCQYGKAQDLEPFAKAVFDALERIPPPQGWSPTGPSDPHILRAFEVGWPATTRS
jgi:hypothetical protein